MNTSKTHNPYHYSFDTHTPYGKGDIERYYYVLDGTLITIRRVHSEPLSAQSIAGLNVYEIFEFNDIKREKK